jgi:multiple sugar transport system substrate-binding protein
MIQWFLERLRAKWSILPIALTACALMVITIGCEQKPVTDRTTIRFVTWKPNVPEVWDEIFRIFEDEHPEIEVLKEVGPHSSTAFHDLLTQKLKNRSRDVDVFLLDVIWPPEFAAAGWALPLDKFFPVTEQEKFLESTVLANTYKGKIYGVPLFIDSGMLYYRKDLLEKYGLTPPRTWQEMVSQAEMIVAEEKKSGLDIHGFSGQFKQYEGLVCDMMEYILSNGGWILNPESGRCELSEKAAVDAVRFVRDGIIGNVAPVGVLTYQEPESIAPFLQGNTVFHRNWPYAWRMSNDAEKSKIVGNVGIAKTPHFPGGQSYATLGGWQVGISSYSQNKEAAWTFAEFLSGERIQKLIALKAGKAPSRKALYQDREILKANPQFSDMKDVFLTSYPRPKSPLYPSISHILQRYFSRVISDPSSEIMREARSACDEIDKVISLQK